MKRFLKLALMVTLTIAVHGAYADTQKGEESLLKYNDLKERHNGNSISGKVIETMNSGGYTYINIERGNKRTWVAAPKMEVNVGQLISFYPGSTMRNFESKTLKRTFESIVFSPGPIEEDKSVTDKNPHGIKDSASVAEARIKVDKASGLNAYTIAELYDKRTILDKKNVVVRGKVVKVSANIMRRNWVHIQDGSGDPKDGSHDLIITSEELPSVGDIVTASGILSNDKDIGSGYKFRVIVEEARIQK